MTTIPVLWQKRNKAIHFCIITILSIAVILLYYLGDIQGFGPTSSGSFLGGQAYHEICILLLAPVLVYAAVIFRMKGAIAISLIVPGAILPHALLFSPYPDPIYREASLAAISLLLGGFIANLLNTRERIEKQETTLARYTIQTLETQETERRYLARELHDDTAQKLVDVAHRIDELIETQDNTGDNQVITNLSILRSDIDGIIGGTRQFIQHLRPPLLEELGLIPALRWLSQQAAEGTDLEVNISTPNFDYRLPSSVEFTLFRIAQEAIANIRKHAAASHLELSVLSSSEAVSLKVADNGVGFAPAIHEEMEKEGKYGIIGIMERARLAGGTALIQSAPGKGTTLTVTIPLASAHSD